MAFLEKIQVLLQKSIKTEKKMSKAELDKYELDDDGNPILDDDGNPILKEVIEDEMDATEIIETMAKAIDDNKVESDNFKIEVAELRKSLAETQSAIETMAKAIAEQGGQAVATKATMAKAIENSSAQGTFTQHDFEESKAILAKSAIANDIDCFTTAKIESELQKAIGKVPVFSANTATIMSTLTKKHGGA